MDERSIAYQLLVELLVHQFAFPVQWTDTQQSLLCGPHAVSRMVELGPARVLANMGQKSLKQLLSDGKIPAGTDVQFLASTVDKQELRYEYAAPTPEDSEETIESTPSPAAEPAPTPTNATLHGGSQRGPASTAPVDDRAMTGPEVVRVLVARKLKKAITEVSMTKSIKDLCGGKSTLQNELVGDLHNEFSSLGDRPEDTPLADFNVTFSAKQPLGKTSGTLVSKLIASKMPAGFGSAAIRSYLAERWGLGPLRQAAVLLHAVVAEPPSRFPSVETAQEYWDKVVAGYAAICGIDLRPRAPEATGGPKTSQLVDSSVVKELTESHRRMATKQYRALAEYLQIDNCQDSDAKGRLLADLQQQLDTWTAEFSDEFLAGVAPRFDAKKARKYTSWWNHAREDVLSLFQGHPDDTLTDNTELDALVDSIIGRADINLVEMVQSLGYEDLPARLQDVCARIKQGVAMAVNDAPVCRPRLAPNAPRTTVSDDGDIKYSEVPRPGFSGITAYADYLSHLVAHPPDDIPPPIRIRALHAPQTDVTPLFLTSLSKALTTGLTFSNKTILVTGAGPNSIASETIRLLLAGGARVLATTSRAPSAAAPYFRALYARHGAKGSALHLLPFNQASAQDCERLVAYIYDGNGDRADSHTTTQRNNGLGVPDIDAILPFAALPETGADVDAVAPANELAHRAMLVNVLRLLGAVARQKRARGIACRPTQVLVPLSPNHGLFGGDGLYAESKLGLESLLRRVRSEGWGEEMLLSVCGVEIGWTRGTGLMDGNDVVAEAVEGEGVVTFSAREMAVNLVVLMAGEFADLCEDGPVHADFGGGLRGLEDCHRVLSRARQEIKLKAEIARAITLEDERESALTGHTPEPVLVSKKATLRIGFPRLPAIPDQSCEQLVDLARTVVVVGFSELGPWGSARLRWEMEAAGRLSPEGYVEMAWMMGLIRHFDGPLNGGYYVGWVDSKSGEPVGDHDVEAKYGEYIHGHCGIRLVEPGTETGYDPGKKEFLQEVAAEDDLPPFETTLATAEALRLKHGAHVSVTRLGGSDNCQVQIKRGATIMVPKAVPFTWGSVAGTLPTGFDPARYGIPRDLIQQVDPVTLYTLCCVSEAFYSAGMADPVEVFQHIHVSEFGNFIGSSMGGALKTRHLYRDAYLDHEIQADTLQDTYLNTTAAWVNMLLLGAAGPIKTPVGACATGLESIDSAMDSITAGKTKMCLVGGYDDFREEESYGFAKMKATVDVAEELARGRLPSEMSRPTAASRAGFVESHGCGIQLLCRADIAIQMGLPIYAVIAGSAMAADKIGRSVPAPGQGILTFARESHRSPLTGLSTSSTNPHDALSDASDYILPSTTASWTPTSSTAPPTPHPLSPLKSALATWGLTVDDITFASLHGTSTKANDLNEAAVLHAQLAHLGRTAGRPAWAVCQKSVTGHPKAPAAAWMLNGCLQALDTGLIPGNRNADDVDAALRRFHHLCYPTRTVRAAEPGPTAFLLTSFGFGQKSGQVVGVAPRVLFAALPGAMVGEYRERTRARQRGAERAFARAVMGGTLVRVRERPLFEEGDAARVYLDPTARVEWDVGRGEYRFGVGDGGC